MLIFADRRRVSTIFTTAQLVDHEGQRLQLVSTSMRMLRVAILFLICAPAATGQALRGTIVVRFYSKDKIIFAGDSRTSVHGSDVRSDKECKLLALNGKLIVAVGGNVGGRAYEDTSGKIVFTPPVAQKFAREEASGLRPDERDPVAPVASAWAAKMQEFDSRQGVPDAASQKEAANGIAISWAFFASTNSLGQLVVVEGDVFWDAATQSFKAGYWDHSQPSDQFEANDTRKSDPFFQRLKNTSVPNSYHPEWKDRDAAKAVYITEKTRDLAHDDRIGGGIDAVELRKGVRKPEWIQLKRGCPAH